VNDRWGNGDKCQHGSYFTCSDRYNPGKLVNHKWENAMTLGIFLLAIYSGNNYLNTLKDYLFSF
jgi:hypothetical protein